MTDRINVKSKEYPNILKDIPNPPDDVYCRGDKNLLNSKAIAIVGSRNSTDYGRWVAFNLGKKAAYHGVTVVSGMAEGIDSHAHKGCLEGEGKTVAVLASGTDICYPRSNRNLYKEILEKGLILSEYKDGEEPKKYTFPQRNRIISGLSTVTVIVEAGIKSGALITAEYADEQSRQVYAVPGNIDRKASFGCNKLIEDGAGILVTMDDVFRHMKCYKSSGTDIRKHKDLSETESKIVNHICENGETTIDNLANYFNCPASKMTGIVTVLEMKGYVQTAFGKIFIEN